MINSLHIHEATQSARCLAAISRRLRCFCHFYESANLHKTDLAPSVRLGTRSSRLFEAQLSTVRACTEPPTFRVCDLAQCSPARLNRNSDSATLHFWHRRSDGVCVKHTEVRDRRTNSSVTESARAYSHSSSSQLYKKRLLQYPCLAVVQVLLGTSFGCASADQS